MQKMRAISWPRFAALLCSKITVEIAPGPASIGTARGVMAISVFFMPASVSSSVSRTRERSARNMSSATSNSTMLPAIWNAGKVMPRTRKIKSPARANVTRMPALTKQASCAIFVRCCGVSLGVMARKAGTTPSGSMMAKSDVVARRMNSIVFMPAVGRGRPSGRTGRENRLAHPVNYFFVGRANRRQYTAEAGSGGIAFAGDKIVRAQPHATGHGHDFFRCKIKPFGLDCFRSMKSLQHRGSPAPVGERAIHGRRPFFGGKIAPQKNTARTPGAVGKPGDFQNQFTLTLGKCFELFPVGQIQLRNGGVRRQRRRIQHPRIRRHFQQALKKIFAEILAPEITQVPIP